MGRPVTRIIAIISVVLILAIIIYRLTPGWAPGAASQTGVVPSNGASSVQTSMDLKLAELKKELDAAYLNGQPQEVSLVLTETEANEAALRLIQQSGTQIPMQIKAIRVDFQTGNSIRISVDAVTFMITYTMIATEGVRVDNSALVINIISVEAPFLLSSYKDAMGGMVKQETELLLQQFIGSGLGYGDKIILEYTGVQTDDSSITIKAMAKPVGSGMGVSVP